MKDATYDAGSLVVSTSWSKGSDSQNIYGVHMKFTPSAAYTVGGGQLELAMAKDAFTSPM